MTVNFDQAPMLLFWETTKACTVACRHCRAEAIPAPMPGQLTPTVTPTITPGGGPIVVSIPNYQFENLVGLIQAVAGPSVPPHRRDGGTRHPRVNVERIDDRRNR